jgi:hypothetical protein
LVGFWVVPSRWWPKWLWWSCFLHKIVSGRDFVDRLDRATAIHQRRKDEAAKAVGSREVSQVEVRYR